MKHHHQPRTAATGNGSPNFASGTIWTGDNLHMMRGINDGCIDLIYLDPPFNSNRNYEAPIGSRAAGAAFKDAWTLDDVDVCEHGELADRNPAAYSIIEAARLAHGKGMMSYCIFMAVRLLEMRRILKPTGSIYLHCDPTASHYLKLLMDAVFGSAQCRNEIVWKRNTSHNSGKQFGRIHDTILFYSAGPRYVWNRTHVARYSEAQLSRFRKDASGRLYKGDDLTAARPSSDSGKFEWRGTMPGPSRGWAFTETQLEEFWRQGRILTKRDGTPRLDGMKVYLDELPGPRTQSIWEDIPRIPNTSAERTGYPTQKPVALLDRIIRASSNEGDLILDPFCGCATALVAADRLGRQWAGIDLSPLAIRLVDERITQDRGPIFKGATALTDPPTRTDMEELPHYRTHKHRLYGEQEGICTGCSTHFPFRIFEVDHILPTAQGGTDHPDNLQLLCNACNRSKGNRTMAEWKAGRGW